MSSDPLPKAIVVCGPTGVGKTRFAIDLALGCGGHIIGADSMQVYRLMDIGTAKPTPAETAQVPHYLVDCIDPDGHLDASAYGRMAYEKVQALQQRRIPAFVVGGTGLYIKALVFGLSDARPGDEQVRRQLQKEADQVGAAVLHQRLAVRDPAAARHIHPNDTYRVIRALEVLQATGRSIQDHHGRHGFSTPRVQTLKLALTLPRDQLYDRIDQRVEAMLAAGFVKEVEGLLARGYGADLKAMQSLGYRHIVDYLQGRLDWDETVRTIKRDHRRYAKRQLTWFSADPQVHWLAPGQQEEATRLVHRFLDAGDGRTN